MHCLNQSAQAYVSLSFDELELVIPHLALLDILAVYLGPTATS